MVYIYIYIYIYIYTHTHIHAHTHTHIHNGILHIHKKECNNVICSNMDEPRNYHTKWSKLDREMWISYDIAYIWTLKNNTRECIFKIETDSQI